MRIKNLLKGTVNTLVAAATTLSLQYPVTANYNPHQTVSLRGFSQALRDNGFAYGGYSQLPYCFNTRETLNGVTPVVVVCPLKNGRRDSDYSVGESASVSAIWVSMLLDGAASRELTRRALRKTGLVTKVFAHVRYNVTASSVCDVMTDEIQRAIKGEGVKYKNSRGNSCYKRTRNLTNIGTFETRACFQGGGQTQVTVWF